MANPEEFKAIVGYFTEALPGLKKIIIITETDQKKVCQRLPTVTRRWQLEGFGNNRYYYSKNLIKRRCTCIIQ